MISLEVIDKLGKQNQMTVFPNIVREYFQHVFLSVLYSLPGAEKFLFKGGTALRIVFGSPRFSEDLDFSLVGVEQKAVKSTVEELFVRVLSQIEHMGIRVELGEKIGTTSGGYFGVATFRALEYPPVAVEINISSRNRVHITGEVDSIANDFVPTYILTHLSQSSLVEEKVFSALLQRKKPRDFYDLYFIMRKGMLSIDQKKRLVEFKEEIIDGANAIDLRAELGAFLPVDQQAIIRDFSAILERELNRQIV